MERPKPYIGVTGFMSRAHVEHVLSVSDCVDRLIMVGVLVSGKTLRQETNKWPERYPQIRAIRDIFAPHPQALNLLHFNVDPEDDLLEYLYRAYDMGGALCNGMQLNIAWPDPTKLGYFRKHTNRRANTNLLVLQCGKRALDEMQWDTSRIIEKLEAYEGLVEYVLVDPSAGTGADYDPVFAFRSLRDIHNRLPWLGVGIAGGFSPSNVREKILKFRDFTDFSIDAEGRLQKPDKQGLDVDLAKDFVQHADGAFRVLSAAA